MLSITKKGKEMYSNQTIECHNFNQMIEIIYRLNKMHMQFTADAQTCVITVLTNEDEVPAFL